MIHDCPVSQYNATNASTMFSPQLGGVRRKRTRRKHKLIVADYMANPMGCFLQNKPITLLEDMFFCGWHYLPTDSLLLEYVPD